MSKLVFHGEGAGLGRVERGGDANSIHNYVIECLCGRKFPLGGTRHDAEGTWRVGCPCGMATVVDKNGQIKVAPIATILKEQEDKLTAKGSR